MNIEHPDEVSERQEAGDYSIIGLYRNNAFLFELKHNRFISIKYFDVKLLTEIISNYIELIKKDLSSVLVEYQFTTYTNRIINEKQTLPEKRIEWLKAHPWLFYYSASLNILGSDPGIIKPVSTSARSLHWLLAFGRWLFLAIVLNGVVALTPLSKG